MNDLLTNPNYLAHRINFEAETVEFLPIETEEIRQVSFLRRQAFSTPRELVSLPLSEVAPLLNSATSKIAENPPRFIFHTAFCASTFLSRCLDHPGISLGLREPQILLDAANAKRLQWHSNTTRLTHHHLPLLALALLQKHAGSNGNQERLVIKPVNPVNNIIPELLQASASANSLMLYTDARNFVFSTLRKGEEARQTTRAMFDLVRCDFPHLENLRISDVIHMSDLKLIMTLWRLQIDQAEGVLQHFSAQNRLASMHGEAVNEDLAGVLTAVSEFLQLPFTAKQISAICDSEQRFKDAKNPDKPFSVEARQREYERLQQFYGEDVDRGLNWMVNNNPRVRIEPNLSGALNR